MKALTICQPYAELIACKRKRVENRTWPTNFRGPMYIHAGKSREWLDIVEDEFGEIDSESGCCIEALEFGMVVAIASVIDCLSSLEIEACKHDKKYPWLRAHEHMNGPWCWILDDVSRVQPFAWKGQLGLFEIDPMAARYAVQAPPSAPHGRRG